MITFRKLLLKWVITTDPFLATLKIVEQVLKITFTAWNAVVLDTVKGNARHVIKLRELTADDPMSAALLEQMRPGGARLRNTWHNIES